MWSTRCRCSASPRTTSNFFMFVWLNSLFLSRHTAEWRAWWCSSRLYLRLTGVQVSVRPPVSNQSQLLNSCVQIDKQQLWAAGRPHESVSPRQYEPRTKRFRLNGSEESSQRCPVCSRTTSLQFRSKSVCIGVLSRTSCFLHVSRSDVTRSTENHQYSPFTKNPTLPWRDGSVISIIIRSSKQVLMPLAAWLTELTVASFSQQSLARAAVGSDATFRFWSRFSVLQTKPLTVWVVWDGGRSGVINTAHRRLLITRIRTGMLFWTRSWRR